MIEAFVFDLDNTLVGTEELKNAAYVRAVHELSSNPPSDEEITRACIEMIGTSAPETAMALVERFGLADAARARLGESQARQAWPKPWGVR